METRLLHPPGRPWPPPPAARSRAPERPRPAGAGPRAPRRAGRPGPWSPRRGPAGTTGAAGGSAGRRHPERTPARTPGAGCQGRAPPTGAPNPGTGPAGWTTRRQQGGDRRFPGFPAAAPSRLLDGRNDRPPGAARRQTAPADVNCHGRSSARLLLFPSEARRHRVLTARQPPGPDWRLTGASRPAGWPAPGASRSASACSSCSCWAGGQETHALSQGPAIWLGQVTMTTDRETRAHVAEVEIGRGKSGRRAYGFDDIAIVPSRRTRDPEDVDISWEIDAYSFELPLMASAMDGVVSPATADRDRPSRRRRCAQPRRASGPVTRTPSRCSRRSPGWSPTRPRPGCSRSTRSRSRPS